MAFRDMTKAASLGDPDARIWLSRKSSKGLFH
jgi:hypothetical protein